MLSSKALKNLEEEVVASLSAVGNFISEHWQEQHTLSYKNQRDSATEIDVQAENMLRDKLSILLPEAGFIVEEGKSKENNDYNWVIDPIDGTKQFAQQMPFFNTQCALMFHGEPVLGAVLNPISRQLFSASKGNGTRLNGGRLNPVFNRVPNQAIVDVDFGGGDSKTLTKRLAILKELITRFYRVRMFAGIYSPYILTGALDATISIVGQVKVYDYAPHDIIFTEAGIHLWYGTIPEIGEVRLAGYPTIFNEIQQIIAAIK